MAPYLFCPNSATVIDAQGQQRARLPMRVHSARWLTRLLLMGCCASVWITAPDIAAQGRKPALVVSSQLWMSPGTEKPLEVSVVPSDAVPANAMIVIRGVPPGIRFSEGRPFGPGVWVIPVARLTNLKLHAPADTGSGGTLTLVLTSLEGTSIAEARTAVTFMPPSNQNTNTTGATPRNDPPPATGSPAPPAPSPVAKPPLPNRAELLMLLEKGRENAKLGNLLIARQFYLRAAEKGLAEAALALAATYDPRELKGVAGVTPEPALARKWYEKARELGSPDAAARLSELGRP
jgi:hypothetical protein